MDAIDENGTTLFAYIQGYQNPLGLNPGFVQAYSNVSSVSGYNQDSASDPTFSVIGRIVAPALTVSTINGAPVDNSSFDNQFSTLFVSSLNFSTATSVGSNAGYNIPLFINYDHAQPGGATANDVVAIAVRGTNLQTGAVINQIEMGSRGSGENYIMSVWPGQNLEELFIDATDLTVRDGIFSTIINLDPFGLQTTGGIKGPFMSTLDLNVSSINNIDARPAFTNNIQTSSMTLFTGSTTLLYWDSVTTSSNINTSGYDVGVGLNGTFKIGASLQFINVGGTDEVEFFFLKNNAVISQAGGIVNIANGDELLAYCEVIEPLVNGDTIQVGTYTSGTNVFLSTVNGTVIQSPAAILTMYRVDS